MRTKRAAGGSYNAIADELNDAGINPRSGVRWYGHTVWKILAGKRLESPA